MATLISFRFWPGFTDAFPFHRFDGLGDDVLCSRLHDFATEQVRARRVELRNRMQFNRRSLHDAVRRQSSQRSLQAAPVISAEFRTEARKGRRWHIRRAFGSEPFVCRVGALLGWWSVDIGGKLPCGNPVSRSYPVAVVDDDVAEQLCRDLQAFFDRFGGDHASADGSDPWPILSYHFCPRFIITRLHGRADRASSEGAIRRLVNGADSGSDARVAKELVIRLRASVVEPFLAGLAERRGDENKSPDQMLSAEERALALLITHSDWSDKQIATAVGVARTTVYKWTRYKEAKKAMRSSLPRGKKDGRTGDVEAWDEAS